MKNDILVQKATLLLLHPYMILTIFPFFVIKQEIFHVANYNTRNKVVVDSCCTLVSDKPMIPGNYVSVFPMYHLLICTK